MRTWHYFDSAMQCSRSGHWADGLATDDVGVTLTCQIIIVVL